MKWHITQDNETEKSKQERITLNGVSKNEAGVPMYLLMNLHIWWVSYKEGSNFILGNLKRKSKIKFGLRNGIAWVFLEWENERWPNDWMIDWRLTL